MPRSLATEYWEPFLAPGGIVTHAQTNLLLSGDQVSIQASILNRFGEVGGLNPLLAFQVGNGAGDLELILAKILSMR